MDNVNNIINSDREIGRNQSSYGKVRPFFSHDNNGVLSKKDIPVRTDEDRVNDSGKRTGSGPITEAAIPSRPGAEKRDFLDMTALIRSIQRAEGNPDCFMKGEDDCDRLDCSWRLYCQGATGHFEKGRIKV